MAETKPEEVKKDETKAIELTDAASNFLKEAGADYERFVSQRNSIEEKWAAYDYMSKCAQNRSMAETEKEEGTNSTGDERAQTGSTLFHRQVNQLASIGTSVQMSASVPFKYVPISNPDIFYSKKDAESQAHQHNIVAKWTMKKDRFNQKSITFWHQLYKYGNLPIGIFQKTVKKKIKIFEPIFQKILRTDGSVDAVMTGKKAKWKDMTVDNYPSLKIYQPESVFADTSIGTIQQQNCVIVESLMNMQEILDMARSKEFDKEAVDTIKETHIWTGGNNSLLRQERKDNSEITSVNENNTGMYLVRDIFKRCPIKGDEWDAIDTEPKLYWGTVIGNSITDGVVVRLEENRDPDDEIPIEMIHAFPDDEDSLYHVAPGDVIRSDYSVESTIKNQAIDNVTLVNSPPLLAVEGMHRISDFTFKANAVWPVDDIEAVKEFQVRDTTMITVPFLEFIRNDAQTALGTDKPFMGQSFGARTSALEASNIYRNSLQPQLICVRYVLEQYLYFYARKHKSYWQAFALPGQTLSIADEEEQPTIYSNDLYGEFDVEINIVDEFEDDVVAQRNINETIKVIGMVPAFQQRVNMEELLKKWFEIYNLNSPNMISAPMDADAVAVARRENITMMQLGESASVKPGENNQIHLSEHKGERLRYQGLEDQYPNVSLLDQHIAQTEMAAKQSGASYTNLPAADQSQGPGEVGGNEIAAAMGNKA